MINPVGLIAFGNMGSGGGLPSVFNADASTGYAMASTGWAGLTLAEPTRIKSVTITSASNGFDASGSTTPITLRLYGKNGSPPSGPSDGVMLASLSFTDANAVTVKTLTSADNITLFDHVWFSISTGVWSIAQYAQFEEATEATSLLPPPDLTRSTIYTSQIDTAIALPWSSAELISTRWTPLEIVQSCSAMVDITCDFKHLNVGGYEGPIGIGWSFGRRSGTTLEAMVAAPWVRDFSLSTQIASIEHHYTTASRAGAIDLAPGFHQFSFYGTAHTTASSSNGHACLLVEGGKGLNCTRLIVLPGVINSV